MSSCFALSCRLCDCGCGDRQCGWECVCTCCSGLADTSLVCGAVSPGSDWVEVPAPVLAAEVDQHNAGASPQYKIVCVDSDGYETSSPWVPLPPHELVAAVLAKRDTNPAAAILCQRVLDLCEEYLAQHEGICLSPDALRDVATLLLNPTAQRAKKCYMLSSN